MCALEMGIRRSAPDSAAICVMTRAATCTAGPASPASQPCSSSVRLTDDAVGPDFDLLAGTLAGDPHLRASRRFHIANDRNRVGGNHQFRIAHKSADERALSVDVHHFVALYINDAAVALHRGGSLHLHGCTGQRAQLL